MHARDEKWQEVLVGEMAVDNANVCRLSNLRIRCGLRTPRSYFAPPGNSSPIPDDSIRAWNLGETIIGERTCIRVS